MTYIPDSQDCLSPGNYWVIRRCCRYAM